MQLFLSLKRLMCPFLNLLIRQQKQLLLNKYIILLLLLLLLIQDHRILNDGINLIRLLVEYLFTLCLARKKGNLLLLSCISHICKNMFVNWTSLSSPYIL
ncbi:uncharacterized protein BX663DRAFT_565337 [Cokeromyces recurvatus]|uniref:uncharacterized protein n=1 Tax=Cokeromyces recurvatus TaxID=90255 RepID=UPI00221F92F4|nr:uncharacterized protein BX663DRAFT_565337 [Cokeromyces recurvatus]KAI7897675.1 hypothetical protein BX663DRAFT_565337 [Cokeromyces recurvatus]